MSDTNAPTEREKAAFAPFRPRRARAVALSVALVSLLIFGGVAFLLPARVGDGIWEPANQIMLFGIGIVIALLAWRYAAMSAIPSRERLVVRNLVLTRTLEWPEIVGVQFGGGQPWVQVDLADLETLAVMAIQKADGPFANREAARLAALVAALGEPREPLGHDGSNNSGRPSESGDDE